VTAPLRVDDLLDKVYGAGGSTTDAILDRVYGKPKPSFADVEGGSSTAPARVASPEVARALFSDDGLHSGAVTSSEPDPRVMRAVQGQPRLSERMEAGDHPYNTLARGLRLNKIENIARGVVPGAVRAVTDIARLPEQVTEMVRRIPENLASPTQMPSPLGVVFDALRGGVPEAPIAEKIVGPVDEMVNRIFEPEGTAGALGQLGGMVAAGAGANRVLRPRAKVTPAQFDAAVDEARGIPEMQEPPRASGGPATRPAISERAPTQEYIPEPVQGPTKPPPPTVSERGVVPTAPQARRVEDRFDWMGEVGTERGVGVEAVELRKLKKLTDDELLTEVARVQREQGTAQTWVDRANLARKPHQAKFEARSKAKALNLRTRRLEEELQRRGLAMEDVEERLAIEGGESQYPRKGIMQPDVPFSKESGKGALQIMGGTAGAGVGGTIGAKQIDEGDSTLEKIAKVGGGIVAGAAAGVGAGRVLESVPGKAGIAPPVADDAQDALDALLTPAERDFRSRPVGKPAPAVSATADDYANLRSFNLDPTGEQRLRLEIERAGPQAIGNPKRVVTWEETRAAAQEMGLGDITRKDAKRLTGAELLATRNIIASNIDTITELTRKVDDVTLPEAVRDAASMRIIAIEKQNDNLLGRFITARSQKGRDLNSLKILANRTSDPVVWLAKAKELAGDRYNDEVRATILRLLGDEQGMVGVADDVPLASGERGALGVTQAQVAQLTPAKRQALVSYMASLRRATLGEKIITFVKAGLLTNPKTHAVNISSNTTMAALETVKDAPAALFDRLLSLSTGERTKTLLNPAELARASATGIRQGLRDAKLVLQGKLPEDALRKLDIPRQVNYDNLILDTYTKKIFQSMGAEDRVFRGIAMHRSLTEQAKILAIAEGLKGEARAQRIKRLVAAPSDEMVLRGIRDAETATFQDATRAGKMITGFTRPLSVAGDWLAPFKRTPAAVATRVIEYSPVGLPIGLWKAIKAGLGKGKQGAQYQQRAVEILGRSTTGSGFVALGYWLAKEGLATGARPDDANDRDVFDLAGKQANAVLWNGRWQNVGRISPAGNLLALGANLYEAAKSAETKTPGERATAMGASTVRTVLDQPFLTGVQTATSAVLNPQREGGKFVEGLAGMVVPAAVGAFTRGRDPQVRDVSGPLEAIQSKLPGQSEKLPGRYTALGDEMVREPGLMANMLNPLSPRRAETDPLIRELTRVGAGIPRLRPSAGETASQLAQRQKAVGQALRTALTQLWQSSRYRSAGTEEQKNLMESAASRVKAAESRKRRAAQPRQPAPNPR
jgi:hypothetical protein